MALNGGTNFLGKTVLLGADVRLAGQAFYMSGSSNSFKGTLMVKIILYLIST